MSTTKLINIIFDFEVFPNWWCCCTRRVDTPEKISVITSDDPAAVRNLRLLIANCRLIGFNIRSYDLYILYAIVSGCTPSEVYEVSDNIIHNVSTQWTSHFGHYRWNWIDLYSDWKFGSLKMYEANQGMSIVESSVPFGKENLSPRDKMEIIEYCHADTNAALQLFHDREGYFSIHEYVSEHYNIPLQKAYQRTMQGLTAEATGVQKTPCTAAEDKRSSIYVLDYIKEMLDGVDPFAFLLEDQNEVRTFVYDGDVYKLGVGGVHSDFEQPIIVKSNENGRIFSIDVTQYYPNMLMNFDLMPRGMDEAGKRIFGDMIKAVRDLKVKISEYEAAGDFESAKQAKSLRDKYKVLINAVSGAMRNKYSKFYDPSRIITMCAVGEFLLIAVVNDLKKQFPGTEVLQTNTDGAFLYVPNWEGFEEAVEKINKRIGFTFEVDAGKMLVQNNVNNYIFVKDNGQAKSTGSWVYPKRNRLKPASYAISHIAAFKLLLDGTPIEETVRNCTDIMDFAMCVKSGTSFERTIYKTNNQELEVNNTNRFVVSRRGIGTLYKIKDGSAHRFPDCPDNIILINGDISEYNLKDLDIDYDFYIRYAHELIPNFICLH